MHSDRYEDVYESYPERNAGVYAALRWMRPPMKTLFRPSDHRALVLRLRALTPTADRRWGRMSPHQMVCHLADVCRVSLGERHATPVGNFAAHTIIKTVVLYTAVRIPKELPSTPELDQTQRGTTPGEFAADVHALERLFDRFVAGQGPDATEHPFFGKLSRAQWGRFQYKHADHHLRQFGL